MATVSPLPNAYEKTQTEFLAPGFRLVRLNDQLKGDQVSEEGKWLKSVEQDVLRVEVTRVNSGSSQYSITLNNWFDSLPADRSEFSSEDIVDRVGINEKLDSKRRPFQPRYKYNDFKLLRFGDRLRIEMGYRSGREIELGFVPMIAGPITDIKFVFADAGAQLTISGEDDLSALKDKQMSRVEFSKHSERGMVEEILKTTKFPLRIAKPLVAPEKFFEDENEGISESLQKGQSYLDFLQKLADPLDFEVFLEFNSLEDPNSGQSFHFEPCRARRPAKKTEGIEGIHRLVHGVNLMEFTPTIKVADQYSSVEITGKHRDRLRPEQIKELATFGFLKDELHFDPALDQPLLSGPEIRGLFFKGRLANEHSEPASNIDKPRAAWRAQSLLRKKAREFMTIEGTTIGLPKLRPGNHVEIRGMRAPFDGFYYVTKTVHTYGADGFRTRFSAHRPGMPKPQD